MGAIASKGVIEWVETFAGPFSSATNGQVAGRTTYVVASGATFAATGVNGGAGLATLAGDDADAVAVFGPLAFEPDESKHCFMQVTFKTSDADKSSIFVGFSDALTDSVIIEDEDGTLNTVATDAAGVLIEGEQDLTPQTVGVQNDVDNTQTVIGAGTGDTTPPDLADDTYITVGVEINNNDSGTMFAYINGIQRAKRTSLLRTSIVYCPVISFDDRATAYTATVFEMLWSGSIGSTLG